ncbi:hypothetical protein [Fulvivirga ligni]|uniref:hypothetical protein n=1 Tax=Fulvivirga ligni TaxID=2904246 RepID=UPI001F1B65A6|nr:hypothetical protein [Fulvivirga ligni]UII23667.1 hypothetical protein LVD16_10560 [Fulvivirga ligni]
MTFKSPEEFHNKTGFIFHGMLALPLAVFAYLFLEIKNNHMNPVLQDGTITMAILIAVPILSAIIFWVGFKRFRRASKDIKGVPLAEKLSLYYDCTIKFYMSLGLASVLLVTGLYLTTSAVFILGYVFLLFFMSLHRPTPQKYVKDIPLTEQERQVILNKGRFEDLENT